MSERSSNRKNRKPVMRPLILASGLLASCAVGSPNTQASETVPAVTTRVHDVDPVTSQVSETQVSKEQRSRLDSTTKEVLKSREDDFMVVYRNLAGLTPEEQKDAGVILTEFPFKGSYHIDIELVEKPDEEGQPYKASLEYVTKYHENNQRELVRASISYTSDSYPPEQNSVALLTEADYIMKSPAELDEIVAGYSASTNTESFVTDIYAIARGNG